MRVLCENVVIECCELCVRDVVSGVCVLCEHLCDWCVRVV